MTDILGKEIVGFDEALYLKKMGFNGECTGYYHCEEHDGEDSYECAGWRGLFRNSFSQWRAAAPSIRAAKLWYTKNKVKPFGPMEKNFDLENEIQKYLESIGVGYGGWIDGMGDDDLRDIARHFYKLGQERP